MCRLTDGRCFRKIDLEIEFLKQGLAPRAAGVGSNLVSCFSLLFHLDPCPFGWDIFYSWFHETVWECQKEKRTRQNAKMGGFCRWSREWYVIFFSPIVVWFISLHFSFHISSPFDSFVNGVWVIKKEICVPIRLSLPVVFLSSNKKSEFYFKDKHFLSSSWGINY